MITGTGIIAYNHTRFFAPFPLCCYQLKGPAGLSAAGGQLLFQA